MSAAPKLHRDPPNRVVLDVLRQRFGERFSTAASVREQHGRDESFHAPAPPDGVVFVRSTEEVAEVVKLCAQHKVPVIAFGTGTSLEGHVAALHGGICIDVSQMNKVLRVSVDDLDVTVQPGVTRKQLNEYLRDTGLFFPIDPGADASLGGMTATRASGTNAVRYGTMRENVLSLTVVLADGRVIRTAQRARKSAAGYDLTRLFVGSEGTLGVITEITLRLYGIPEQISAAVCPFPTIKDAVDTTVMIIQAGIPIARVELLDALQMDAVNKYSKLDYKVAPTLLFEFHGTKAGVDEQIQMVKDFAAEHGGSEFRFASSMEERNKLWQARHDGYYAVLALRPGGKGLATDVCVPISRLAECITETTEDLEQVLSACRHRRPCRRRQFPPRLHLRPRQPRRDRQEIAAINERLVHRALAMDGTCTGEHGVGYGKMDFLLAEHGEAAERHAHDQEGARPRQHHEPGQDRPDVRRETRPRFTSRRRRARSGS